MCASEHGWRQGGRLGDVPKAAAASVEIIHCSVYIGSISKTCSVAVICVLVAGDTLVVESRQDHAKANEENQNKEIPPSAPSTDSAGTLTVFLRRFGCGQGEI